MPQLLSQCALESTLPTSEAAATRSPEARALKLENSPHSLQLENPTCNKKTQHSREKKKDCILDNPWPAPSHHRSTWAARGSISCLPQGKVYPIHFSFPHKVPCVLESTLAGTDKKKQQQQQQPIPGATDTRGSLIQILDPLK